MEKSPELRTEGRHRNHDCVRNTYNLRVSSGILDVAELREGFLCRSVHPIVVVAVHLTYEVEDDE